MKIIFTLLACLFSFLLIEGRAQNPPLKPLSDEQWREDVDYFAAQLVKRHKNLFHSVSKEEFERDVNKLKADLPSLEDYQVYVRLLQITSKVGDGHTYIPPPADFKIYPVLFYWFGNDLYAVQATADYKQAVGKKLVKVENMPLEQVNAKLMNVLSSQENHWHMLHNHPQTLIRPEILHTLGIVPDVSQAKFVLADEAGNETTLDLVPVSTGSKLEWVRAAKSEPLFRQNAAEPFWFTYVDDINAVYVNFKKYDGLAQNVRKLFDFIDEKKATRLIIDLRQNQGGDFTKVRRQLIPAIKEHPTLNQTGNLFVITGRRTFSAAMVNAIDFKKQTNATIIGEPPGERPNSYSENDELKLPNSKLTVSYSTRYYKFLDNDVPAFEPDIRVDPNWKDYKEGIDPVMEKIKQLMKSR